MSDLPLLNLNDHDTGEYRRIVAEFLLRSNALRGLFLERAGYVLVEAGTAPELDAQEFSALASNAFNAIDRLASCLDESDIKVLHQRGGRHQTLMFRVGHNCMLVAICAADLSTEAIEAAAWPAIDQLEQQLQIASDRLPDVRIDLASHAPNSVETIFFKRKLPVDE
ncbi:MAG: putative regulator of Ras-like GTPase activity (Roadblock/LC7/MglB family) [Limisphaerales bacterium]|jgi:predicted regulator of Ras-like GTPase activity (Roadblock/LC7/MglB family)